MGDLVTLAKKLLDHYPTKAQELLITYLQDKDIRTATEQHIGANQPSARIDAPFEQQHRHSRTSSYHPESSPFQRTTRQNIHDDRHVLHTPPTSAGSVKSHTSSVAAAGLERIYLISCNDDCAEKPVISRSLPVKHNLIRDKVAYGRNLGASPVPVDELVSVPLSSGGQRREKVTTAVNMTWRRRNEFTTNEDTFYIVSAKLLDSDVILGSDESIEHQYPSDVHEAHSPQARYHRGGFVEMEELDPAVPPHAPTAPMHSFQQNSMPPKFQQTYDHVHALLDTHRIHAAETSAPAPRPRHVDHGQPIHTTTPLSAQGPSSGQLQVIGLWDKTPIKMAFDPDAPGEVFYQAFVQWAVRRKRDGDLERHRMTLWLKASKNTPDAEAYELSLKEGELEEFWETAIDWIQENKSLKAPHLYATVELEAG